jgi:hypothetical protein
MGVGSPASPLGSAKLSQRQNLTGTLDSAGR